MALVKAEELEVIPEGFNSMPFARQIALMVGAAASIAVGIAIVLWSQTPNYRMLYGNLSDQEVLEISTALSQSGINFEVNELTGAVLVDSNQVHEARMKLAGQGLPKGSGTGYELLDKDQGFGTSQLIETARYHRAIEGELSRTISSLNNVQSARVHLAIPKQSAFVRDRKKSTASVMLTLYQGRVMTKDQAMSIAHMVASSIPNLEMENVTVVDQSGRLLTRPEVSDEMDMSSTQFDYRRKLEDYYRKRIEELIEPIVGLGKVRAQVVAELDFTVTEQTHESFNPDLPSVRSEQTVEEEMVGGGGASGVPGTLSNQPPQAGGAVGDTGTASSSRNSSRRIVRNYELDRTISHTRQQIGNLQRLSVAVVIDDKAVAAEDGTLSSEPRTTEEIDKITTLVREAVGFDVVRGDSINVINAAFSPAPELAPAPEPSFMDNPLVWEWGKKGGGILLGFVLLLMFVKPLLRSLVEKGQSERALAAAMEQRELESHHIAGELPSPLASNPSYEQQVEVVRAVAKQEPQRMAQVVREWVEKDG